MTDIVDLLIANIYLLCLMLIPAIIYVVHEEYNIRLLKSCFYCERLNYCRKTNDSIKYNEFYYKSRNAIYENARNIAKQCNDFMQAELEEY